MAWRERARIHGDRGSVQRTLLVIFLVTTVALGATIAYAVWRGDLLTADPAAPPPGSDSTPGTGTGTGTTPSDPTSSIELVAAPTPPPVLVRAETVQPLSPSRLERRLSALLASPALSRRLGLVVAPLADDGRAWSPAREDQLVTPASTLKLLTATTALEVLGPDHVFQTSVVSGRSPHSVVLVGGGDPLLTDAVDDGDKGDRAATSEATATAYPHPASLEELADRTAAALRSQGVRWVELSYDDSLFRGPAVNPTWPRDYLTDDVVSPITALWVDEGREVGGYARRVADPSSEAAKRFGALLGHAGIQVRGEVVPRAAPARSGRLASVTSAPLAQIVQHVLELSDNEGAEVLLRQAAISSGRPGSFASGVGVVEQTVVRLGVHLDGATLYDGSGLSRRDLLPIGALVDVLQVAADPKHPELRSVVSSLPVAGFTGSLDYRFVDDAPSGLGLVRAKTGTLTGVHALAGVVVTADGAPLAFAAVANQVPVRLALDARVQLDRIAASLATCRCARSTG